ncbi:MAG: ABC transporter substrate-binding protein [Nitrospirae bacterium]|nr:ABC transporter substrate-binding protein [Nitrospirota bacterium]
MSEKSLANVITRRTFLKIAGAATGALTVPSQVLAFGGEASPLNFSGWPVVRLGILLPGKDFSPKLTGNFLSGFDHCLKTSGCAESGVSVELVKEHSSGSVSVSALKKLLHEDKVNLVTGILNNAAASSLSSFARDEKFVLVASSLGESMARKTDMFPGTFHCSMNFSQANWAMGRWAADNMGPSCVVAASFYDTGYDTLQAFRMGYQIAGGMIKETFISDAGSGTPNFDRLFSAIEAARPDFIYALYSGSQGAGFIKAYASSGLAGRIPLACSSHLSGGDSLAAIGPLAAGIKTCVPWRSDLCAPGSESFAANYAKVAGRSLDSFGLLGYETAGMILSALSLTQGKTGNITALTGAFAEAAFNSPRGRLQMNPMTNATSAPLFIHEFRMEGGRPVTRAIAECSPLPEYDRRLQPMWVAERSGWHNAYQYA